MASTQWSLEHPLSSKASLFSLLLIASTTYVLSKCTKLLNVQESITGKGDGGMMSNYGRTREGGKSERVVDSQDMLRSSRARRLKTRKWWVWPFFGDGFQTDLIIYWTIWVDRNKGPDIAEEHCSDEVVSKPNMTKGYVQQQKYYWLKIKDTQNLRSPVD